MVVKGNTKKTAEETWKETAREDIFAFLHSIMKKMRKIADRELFPLGMSHCEMRLLMMIYDADGCSQEELASRLEVDHSNVSRALKKLENLNYIQKEKDKKDRRGCRVFLSKKGWDMRDYLCQIKKNMKKAVARRTTARELRALAALLEKVDRGLTGN